MADDEKEEEKPRQRIKRQWDEETRNKYQDEMEEIIIDMIGDHKINSAEIEKFVDEIVDIAQKKLKRARIRRYVYWTSVFVCRTIDKHKRQSGMSWEDRYDHAITVQAKNEHVRVVLASFCCSLNTF